MGALAGLNDLVNRATGGNSGTPENMMFSKWDRIAGTAITFLQNRMYSLWAFDGHPGAGVTPGGTAAVPDSTTNGGLKQTGPGVSRQKWMTSFQNWGSAGQGSLLVYDRLLHIGGLSGTVTTPQTVGGAITRYTGSNSWNNQVWFEIYSSIGTTTTTITMSYTDQDGNAGITSVATAFGGTTHGVQGRAQPLNLAAGDTGVRAVASVTLAATTGTAGDFGITILRPLAELPFLAIGGGGLVEYVDMLPEIFPGACLAFMFIPHTVSRLGILGAASFVES